MSRRGTGAAALPSGRRALLAIVDALGGDAADRDVHAALARWCAERGEAAPYEFVHVDGAPHSFVAAHDAGKLAKGGFLAQDGGAWRLTDAGRAALASEDADAEVATIARRVRKGGGGEESAPRAVRRGRKRPGLSTVGYEGRSLEAYLNGLLAAGVTLLCDVRANPQSRKFGFAKGTLSEACARVGIRYEHLPELGIPTERRRGVETPEDYRRLFARYARETLPKQGAALATIHEWVRAGEHVALTCYERDPAECHRHCVAEALAAEYGEGMAAGEL